VHPPGTGYGSRRIASRAFGFALGSTLLLCAARSAPHSSQPQPDAERPATGCFLVAADQIRGSFFEHSVVFLLSYGEDGALGLVVNHRSDIDLHDFVKGAVDGAGALYLGGPVGRESVLVLVRAASAPARAVRVAGDVYLTVDPAILLEHTAHAEAARDLRVYIGYAGWGRGQLEGEIARGDWIVASEGAEAIFDEAPDDLWKKLHLRHHRLITAAPPIRLASAH
jgi:putative transcriptional regulator